MDKSTRNIVMLPFFWKPPKISSRAFYGNSHKDVFKKSFNGCFENFFRDWFRIVFRDFSRFFFENSFLKSLHGLIQKIIHSSRCSSSHFLKVAIKSLAWNLPKNQLGFHVGVSLEIFPDWLLGNSPGIISQIVPKIFLDFFFK